MSRARPVPPHPELVRRPAGSFGWLEDRLLHEGWLARLGPEATAVLVLLALAADERGASFFGRDRMAQRLGLPRAAVDQGLARLLDWGFVAHRPWRAAALDGVWQLLPLPPKEGATPARPHQPLAIADILGQLGLAPPAPRRTPAKSAPRAPESRAF